MIWDLEGPKMDLRRAAKRDLGRVFSGLLSSEKVVYDTGRGSFWPGSKVEGGGWRARVAALCHGWNLTHAMKRSTVRIHVPVAMAASIQGRLSGASMMARAFSAVRGCCDSDSNWRKVEQQVSVRDVVAEQCDLAALLVVNPH